MDGLSDPGGMFFPSVSDILTGEMTNQLDCTGTVDFFNETGGYGFLTTDAVDEDVFFHLVDFPRISTIDEGDTVQFTYEHAEKGPRVSDMEVISSSAAAQGHPSGGSTGSVDQSTQVVGPETGSITFYNDTGKYGFISSNQVDKDVFFSLHDVDLSALEEGDRVRFSYRHAEKEPRVTEMERTETHLSADAGGATIHEMSQSQTPSSQLPGQISFYNDTGEYGFISADAVEEDVFFQCDEHPIDDWSEGRYVLFRFEQAENGPVATDVRYAAGGDSDGGEETAVYSHDADTTDETTKLFNPDT